MIIMGCMSAFDFKDASIKGDPKWARTSPNFGAYAPPVVIVLAILSIIEIVLGVVWITGIQSLANGYNDLSLYVHQRSSSASEEEYQFLLIPPRQNNVTS